LSTRPVQIVHFVATPARVSLRRTAGDVSRHLHTLWVAVETLARSPEIRPADLHLGWAKPLTAAEWTETREFVAKSAMTSMLDGVDQYMKVLGQMPRLTDPSLASVLKGTARTPAGARLTIFARFATVVAQYSCAVGPEQLATIELLATWRNQFVHGGYRHSLGSHTRSTLERAGAYFRNSQGGADIAAALARFDARQGPTLADLVTLITTCQVAVATVDEHLLHLQAPADLAVANVEFALAQNVDPSALLERLFVQGGRRSSGAVLALLHRMGVVKTQGYVGSAPSMTRPAFDGVIGMGRNAASALFGIARP